MTAMFMQQLLGSEHLMGTFFCVLTRLDYARILIRQSFIALFMACTLLTFTALAFLANLSQGQRVN